MKATKLSVNGRMFHSFVASESEMSSGDMGGCVYCGEEAYGVEPDARKYECECCEKRGVFGLDELLVMGYLNVVDDEELMA